MVKHFDKSDDIDEKIFVKRRNKVRTQYAEIAEQKKSIRELCKEWAKSTYALKCKYFLEADTSEDGNTTWIFNEPMESDIEPFKDNVSDDTKRLASTALVQYAQKDKPLKVMDAGFHSRNYKYAAVFQYAHEQEWDSKRFGKEIDQKGGLTRLLNLYLKSIKKQPTETTSDDEETEEEESEVIKNVQYFEALPKKQVFKTKEELPSKYDGKIVVARIHSNGFEILGKFPKKA